MRVKKNIKWLDIFSLLAVVYCFFGVVYLEANPLKWQISGIMIAMVMLGVGLKSHLYERN